MHYLQLSKHIKRFVKTMTLLLLGLLLPNFAQAGFNFGECSGSGTFEQQINHYHGDFENTVTVGTIPAGIIGLRVELISDRDVDIRLYGENDDRIVHWPYGLLSFSYAQTKPYHDVNVTYSGYNGVDGERGHEFIEVDGTTPTAMTMKAFGYQYGYATVNYSWTGKVGCTQEEKGEGSFTQTILNKATNLVGTIPPGVKNVNIKLTSEKDLDIQLYGSNGTAIASWKPTGLMAGPTEQSVDYQGMHIVWSGYNGIDNKKGHESIEISGYTTELLVMKVYGYEAGEADVTYSWGSDVNTSKIMGHVASMLDGDIASVHVDIVEENQVLSQSDITSDNGNFELVLPSDTNYTLNFTAKGYATQVTRVTTPPVDGIVQLDVRMIASGTTVTVPTEGNVTGRDGASVEVDTLSFVDPDGNVLSAEDGISVTITPVDVSTPQGLEAFPGAFRGIAEDNNETSIVSYGTTEYTFTKASTGEELQLEDNQQVKILLPIYVIAHPNGTEIKEGDTIPLWSLNEKTGIWLQEGNGTVVKSTQSPTGLAMQAYVSHFTWWNCDAIIDEEAEVIIRVPKWESRHFITKAIANIHSKLQNGRRGNVSIDVGGQTDKLPVPADEEVCFWADVVEVYDKHTASQPGHEPTIPTLNATCVRDRLYRGKTIEKCVSTPKNQVSYVDLKMLGGSLEIGATPTTVTIFKGEQIPSIDIFAKTMERGVIYSIDPLETALPEGLSLQRKGFTKASIAGVPTQEGEFDVIVHGVTETDYDIPSCREPNTAYAVEQATVTIHIKIVDKESIIEKISNYANGTGPKEKYNDNKLNMLTSANGTDPKPTLQDYHDIKLDMVTSENIVEMNERIFKSTKEEVDTYIEIKRVLLFGVGVKFKLLSTGQTNSYTPYDDGYYQAGLARSYTRDDAKEVVIDNVTRLMWQDDEAAKTVTKPWVTQANYNAGKYDDTSGDTAATYCENLELGGYTDWRLPTSKELESIVDYGKVNPAIDTTYFNNVSSNYYWSATTNQYYSNDAWIVYFYYGGVGYGVKDYNYYVRCVRAGQ